MNSIRHTVYEYCSQADSVGIMSHIHPDGDGFASSLALKTILGLKGIQAKIIMDQGDLTRYDYLSGSDQRIVYHEGLSFQTLIILDCNNESRLGERSALIPKARHVLIIDHHEHEDGVIANVFQFISTAEVCVGTILFKAFRDNIAGFDEANRKYVADCLYTGIINDTNNFTNINTNPDVFTIASELCRFGLIPAEIHKSYFSDHDPLKLKLVGEVLSTLELHYQNKILIVHSTLDMLSRNGQPIESLDNMTKWVQGSRGVDVIVYIKEIKPGEYKVSLRSPKQDVNRIATTRGGGGHKSAAGLTMIGDLSQVKRQLIAELVSCLDGSL